VGVRERYRHLSYLNAVLVINAVENPKTVSDIIHAVEADMGRVRTEDRFSPRPIDVDILYAGDTISDDDNLTLPHPRWAERRFVVQPLADINPGLIFPGDHKTVAEILNSLPSESDVTLFTESW
jgi:2-amino-4-hydroxy-6-hydroxymethyldihydropteridine diphosphokinase